MTFAAKMHDVFKSKPKVEIIQEELKLEDNFKGNHYDIAALIEGSNPSGIDASQAHNRLNPFSPLLLPGDQSGKNARIKTEDILPPNFSDHSNEISVSNQGQGYVSPKETGYSTSLKESSVVQK